MNTALKNLYYAIAILLVSVGFFVTNNRSVYAADFIVTSDTKITYQTLSDQNKYKDYVTITTTFTKEVKNSRYILPEGEKRFHIPDMITGITETEMNAEREFKISGLSLKDSNGNDLEYTVEKLDYGNGIYITTKSMPTASYGTNSEIILTYSTHDNVRLNGNLITIYGTSLAKDTEFTRASDATTVQYVFNYSVEVDNNMPTLAKVYPNFTETKEENRTLYTFSQEDRLGQAPVLEFGTEAVYEFNLSYKTTQTDYVIPQALSDIVSAVSTNIYKISLPREYAETNQRVYFTQITPTPKMITTDKEVNIVATLEIPANKDYEINITGYVVSQRDEYNSSSTDAYKISFSEFLSTIENDQSVKDYLKPTSYWESDNPYIVNIGKTILEGLTSPTLLDVIQADYKYVNDTLDYDQSKASNDNRRIGAIAALQGGESVCMEYADSMIAILRSQGIPARAALGYASMTKDFDVQIRHEWVQVWVPNYGWLSVDPTFESNNMKIGKLIDRMLWETFNDDSLSNITVYSADKLEDLSAKNFIVRMRSIEGKINETNLNTYESLARAKNIPLGEESISESSLFFKTTALGKMILIISPVIICIVILSIIIAIIRTAFKKGKKQEI